MISKLLYWGINILSSAAVPVKLDLSSYILVINSLC